MATIGTKFSSTATKVLMLGSGELGKEVVIELQRLGIEVVACDRYENAPAMQVADRSYTFSMLDSEALRKTIEKEKPDLIVPEIEAIATDTLIDLENEGFTVIPPPKPPASPWTGKESDASLRNSLNLQPHRSNLRRLTMSFCRRLKGWGCLVS